MKSKYILLVVFALGLLALAAMLAVQQQQPEEQEVPQGFIPGEAQQGFESTGTEEVPQNVEIIAPIESGAATSGAPTLDTSVPEQEAVKESGADQPEAVEAVEGQPPFVDMMDGGFLPSSLTVSAGTTVTFRNSSNKPIWPASAMHPTHAVYPAKGGCIGSTFDACKGVNPGETWTFIFSEKGTWKYHDHLTPNAIGEISVE